MAEFPLKIVTPSKTAFDGMAKSIILRTKEGDVGILAGHENYVAPLAVGLIKVESEDGQVREGAASYGFVNVSSGSVCVFLMTLEWADEIDVKRAQLGLKEAELKMAEGTSSEDEFLELKAKYERCKARIKIAKRVS